MTATVKILKGAYRGNSIVNETFPLIAGFKMGAKGGFVTVDATARFGSSKIRVKVEDIRSYQIVGGDEMDLADAPVVAEQIETDEEAIARIAERFNILQQMAAATCEGAVRAMIVTGPPGIGKSFGVEQEVDKIAMLDKIGRREPRTEVVKGTASAIGLYQKLYRYRDKGSVVVFDDSDSLFFDDVCLNMLKGALDTGKKRRISWLAESNTLRREDIPDSFEFDGSIIFITNLSFANVQSKKLKEHLAALESRCHFVDLKIDSLRDKILRIKQVTRDGMLDDYDFAPGVVDAIVEFVETHAKVLRNVDLRVVLKAADLAQAFPDKWQQMARTTLLKPTA